MTAETGPRALAVRGESTNGRGRARGAVPRSRFRRNAEGAWVLLGSAIVRSPKVARPRMRAIQALLCFSHSRSRARDDPHRDRLRRAGRLSGLSLPVARPRISRLAYRGVPGQPL